MSWEYSENRDRATLPHIRRAINELRGIRGAKCSRCRTKNAMYLIDAMQGGGRAVCAGCKQDWVALSPLERRQARADFKVRGFK